MTGLLASLTSRSLYRLFSVVIILVAMLPAVLVTYLLLHNLRSV